jgi:hypothetical protein
MFNVFNPWDDEGSFLVLLRTYMRGHADHSQLFGPFFFQVMDGVFRVFGLDITNDNGRLVTLVIWLVGSLIGGIGVLALTRNLWLAAAGQFITFHALSALTNEPMHPEGLVSLLLVGLIAIAANRSRSPSGSSLLIGAVVAAFALTKINVGALAALAVAFAFAATVLNGRARRMALAITGLALVAAPFMLTAGLFGLEWVRDMALVAALSAALVTIAGFVAAPQSRPRMDAVWLFAGGVGVVTLSLGIEAIGGLRPSDLIGSTLMALKFTQVNPLPFPAGISDVVWAALWLVAGAGILLGRIGTGASPAVQAFFRVVVGAFTLLSVLLLPSHFLVLALPLVWVAVLAPAGDHENPTDASVRLLLAALAVMEILMAYPVAGTQLWVAAAFLVPVGAIIFNDGLRQLRAWAADRHSRSFLTVATSLSPGALIVSVAVWPLFVFYAASAYAAGQPLGLPGTELIRVPRAQASSLQSLVHAIDQDCAGLVTMPGMPSLYLWTGRGGISQLNPWMFSLDDAQQQSVVTQIRDQPGMCAVISPTLVDFWAGGRPVPRRPLVEYIDTAFQPAGTFGIYELLISRPATQP